MKWHRFWYSIVAPRVFTEPGSGTQMTTQAWYLLGDSGARFTMFSFSDAYCANRWALTPHFLEEHSLEEANVSTPIYNPRRGWPAMTSCNIVHGADLYHFWKKNDPEALTACKYVQDAL